MSRVLLGHSSGLRFNLLGLVGVSIGGKLRRDGGEAARFSAPPMCPDKRGRQAARGTLLNEVRIANQRRASNGSPDLRGQPQTDREFTTQTSMVRSGPFNGLPVSVRLDTAILRDTDALVKRYRPNGVGEVGRGGITGGVSGQSVRQSGSGRRPASTQNDGQDNRREEPESHPANGQRQAVRVLDGLRGDYLRE